MHTPSGLHTCFGWSGLGVRVCGLMLSRPLKNIEGRDHRVCQDCNKRWMS